MKKNTLIILISIIIFVVALAFFIYSSNVNENLTEEQNIVIEEEISKTKDIDDVKYKDFIIYRSDNSEVKLSDYVDTPVMLLFFSEENDDSMKVLKKVEEMYKNYEGKIQFLMINTAEEVNENLKNEYTIEIYYDFYKEAARNYNITELPSMIYINELNEVFNAKAGFTTTDALEANLDILANDI